MVLRGKGWYDQPETFKYRHSPSVGDAFAPGTAAHLHGTLIARTEADFEARTEVPIVRIGPEMA